MQPDSDLPTRRLWRRRRQSRPTAIEPGEGQESVWDYPRPPKLVPDPRLIEVRTQDHFIASTKRALRVLETASPPTFYLPYEDVRMELLQPATGGSFCEWKGHAGYLDLISGDEIIEQVAWSYERPFGPFAEIADHMAFYPGRLHCYVDGERARHQAGSFYGGWITNEIVGPFKGEPGTGGW